MVTRQVVGILPAVLFLALAPAIVRPQIPPRPGTEVAAPDVRLLRRITGRLRELQNITVTYRQLNDYTPPPKLVARWERYAAHSHMTLNLGHKHFVCRFSFLHGRSFYERRILPGGPYVGLLRQIATFTHQRAESLVWDLQMPKRPLGVISDKAALPNATIDVALGLRAWRSGQWLKPADVMKMRFGLSGANTLTLTRFRSPRTQWWIFRLKPSLELVEYRDAVRPGDGEHVVNCSDFHNIQGVALPGKVVTRFLPYGLHGQCVKRVTLTDLQYKLGPRSNTPASYMITFPLNAVVLDSRTGQSWRVESRPRKMSDSAIYRLLKRSDHGAARIQGESVVKGGVPQAKPGPEAGKPPSVSVPLGVAAPSARSSGATGKWFWCTILLLSLAGLAAVVSVAIRRVRSWKR
ncbi:MAG: hypothetical protein ACP5I8_15500 [Phycisphaerae bacterium]